MGENTVSGDAVEQFCILCDDKISDFVVCEKIDEGAFGQVFKVSKNAKKYAMKVEAKRLDGGEVTIKKEVDVMKELNRRDVNYFPKFINSGKEPKFYFLVMTLLGESLKKLRMKSPNPLNCTRGTWSRIGIQCLFVIKQMHDCGILHHDIKPSNFVLGHPDETLTNRVFHLIDFGISRKFIRPKKGAPLNTTQANHLEFREMNKKVHELKGTPLYTSPNAHAMNDLGRIDDIWSLLYMMAELVKPLPWDSVEGKELEKIKLNSKLKDLFDYESFAAIEKMLRKGSYYTCPDYELVYITFKNIYDSSGCSWLDPFDWETKQMPSYQRWRQNADARRQLFPWEYNEIPGYFRRDEWNFLETISEKLKNKERKEKEKKKREEKKNKKNEDKKGKKKTKGDETGTTTTTVETCEEINSIPNTPKNKKLKKLKEMRKVGK